MSHMIAGIDVHKKMLVVVTGDGSEEGEVEFQRRKFLTTPGELQVFAEWLQGLGVKEVVMESTAQYWQPVWQALEGKFHLELAQAQSNRGPRGRKSDFRDAERLWRRYRADELILSYVPDPEQRLWRTLSRTKVRLVRDKVRLQNRVEALLEEMGIKLSSKVSDLLGVSARRMLQGIANGEKDVQKLADMADPQLRATPRQLCDVLQKASTLDPRYRQVLKQYLKQLELNEQQAEELQKELAECLKPYADQVERLAQVPGLGVDSAQQIIAEVGPQAQKFPTAGDLSSWVGVCPGQNESAEESKSEHSPKGNRSMRRILDQAANAAVKAKGTVFQARYQRIRGRDPKKHNKAIWAVAHHLCRVIWNILHKAVPYEEKGNRPDPRAVKRRATRLLRQLKSLGYQLQMTPLQAGHSA
jgi:transposase